MIWKTWITIKDFGSWNCGDCRKEGAEQTSLNCSRWYEASRLFHWTRTSNLLMVAALVVRVGSWWSPTVVVMPGCTSSLREWWTDGLPQEAVEVTTVNSFKSHLEKIRGDGFLHGHLVGEILMAAWTETVFISMIYSSSRTRWDTRWDRKPYVASPMVTWPMTSPALERSKLQWYCAAMGQVYLVPQNAYPCKPTGWSSIMHTNHTETRLTLTFDLWPCEKLILNFIHCKHDGSTKNYEENQINNMAE